MKYFNKKHAKEIGETIGMSPGNVRVNVSRALEKMKNFFEARKIEWEI